MKKRHRIRGLVAALVLCGSTAAAHDFWVEPTRWVLDPGEALAARLFLGHAWDKESFTRKPSHVEAFELHGPDGVRELVELPGADPAGRVRVPEAGVHVLVYRSRATELELPADSFESYLREEGLEAIVAERERRGESASPGREVYARCAKALVRVGSGSSAGYDRVLGMPAELTPVADPFSPEAATPEVVLELSSGGIPLAGALVEAQSLAGGERQSLQGRTDEMGRVSFPLPRRGAWLFAAVHMTRSEAGGASSHWESWWASLTLEL